MATADKFASAKNPAIAKRAQAAQGTQDTQAAPNTQKAKKKYRVNLALDGELETWLHNISWQQRTSITQYINRLISEDKARYYAEGGDTTGFEYDETVSRADEE